MYTSRVARCVCLAVAFACAGCSTAPIDPTRQQGFSNLRVGGLEASSDALPPARIAMTSQSGDAITLHKDVAFATPMGHRTLKLDVYVPAATPATPHPLIVFVHGGSWTVGDKRSVGTISDWPGVLTDIASLGYVVASVEYRLSAEAPFPAALIDVKTAIRYLRANSSEFNTDAARVAVWGASAGGHLAALVALAPDDPTFAIEASTRCDPALRTQSDRVQCWVGWYGVYDAAEIAAASIKLREQSPQAAKDPQLIGGLRFMRIDPPWQLPPDQRDAFIAWASPLSHVDATDPPALLLHGDADRLVPMHHSQRLRDALAAKGIPVELDIIPGADHSWNGVTKEATLAHSIRALNRTVEYLLKQLPPYRSGAPR